MVHTRRSTLSQPRAVAMRSANASISFALGSKDTTYSYGDGVRDVHNLCGSYPCYPFSVMTNAWLSISCTCSVFDRSLEQLPFQKSYSCQSSQHDVSPNLVLGTHPFPVDTA